MIAVILKCAFYFSNAIVFRNSQRHTLQLHEYYMQMVLFKYKYKEYARRISHFLKDCQLTMP